MAQFEIDDSIICELGAVMAAESIELSKDTYGAVMDSAIHQLCSKQDVVYTNKIETAEYTEWNLAVFDGHGNTRGLNPYSGKYEKYNFTVLALQDMIETKQMDDILNREIFGEEDSALALQRAFSKLCIDKKLSMIQVGATMVHVKVRRMYATKKILVDVLSVGDSVALIHQNGQKVFQTVEHTPFNEDEIARLKFEKRITDESITPGNSFEMLDADTICHKGGRYVDVQGVMMAMTQSVGHIRYSSYELVKEERGIFGLAPYKAHLEFSETDKLNIKLFSDGVSDVVTETVEDDRLFMIQSTATETADFAKSRWEKEWKVTNKTEWEDSVRTGEPFKFRRGKIGADDVACVSLILGPIEDGVA
jgi:serine/threonine protein phosphatase PrpC